MIKRLLIANRGEIAVRIARACRELGVDSVAVYSDADAAAAHVAEANHAVRIGPAAAASSYLSIAAIIEAARTIGADAIHPGYGFLSENAGFAAACERAGLVFVGPPSTVIASMGSKINARRTMESAGVPVVPGMTPDDQTNEGIRRALDSIGLPALIKASSGGGGKGMREVHSWDDVEAATDAARREALAAFGNGTLYVERRIERPHHVEVQIVADTQGHVVHLFERECSVQRRHQKVIEESPSPNITPVLRARMAEAAVRAATASLYCNAGTIEFLVDLSGGRHDAAPFYFLEMNTRLQVEHGVTEAVTGVDLVHAQVLVTSGEALPWSQAQLTQRGHAIEARIYAEDPQQDFLPQAGRVLLYREPRLPGVRVDSGVREGDDIPIDYDPMIAKVVAVAETRALAIARLTAALRAFPILGVRTNIAFLLTILGNDRFLAGEVDTAFLDREAAGFAGPPQSDLLPFVQAAFERTAEGAAAQDGTWGVTSPAAAAAVAALEDPWQRLRGWRAP